MDKETALDIDMSNTNFEDDTLTEEELTEIRNIQEEKKEMRDYLMVCSRSEYGTPTIGWEKCRPVPETDGWFENIWREFRTGEVYSNGEDHE